MDWLLTNGQLKTGKVDIGLKDGRIAAVEPAGMGLQLAEAQNSRDLAGWVVLPGLIDAHTHLDKTFATLENDSGTLGEALDVWRRVHQNRTAADIATAATKAIKLAIVNGVTAMRSHIDINAPNQLLPVEVLLGLRDQFKDQIELQLVGLGTSAGEKKYLDGMHAALAMGVDLVGGCPALCPDPKAEIDAVFELAEQTGKPIDLHVDETEDPQMLSLEYLADKTIAHGMQGRVTAGHCCSLAFAADEDAERIIDKVAAAQINIVTLPSCNLVLMGRNMRPVPRGTTRVKELLAAGVNVCAASDNVHDPFNPFGNYDLLQIGNLNAHTAHMTGVAELEECLSMVTQRAANTLGTINHTIAVGCAADLVVLNSTHYEDAILAPPARLMTFKNGNLLVESKIEQTWYV
ncbi:MAG: amidohydrolase family protein [Chloroflexota bacterium]